MKNDSLEIKNIIMDYYFEYISNNNHHFTSFLKKRITYRTLWCIMNLLKYITKESDPIRQIYYTTKRTWLVDFINIFIIILKPVPCLQQNLYSCWFYPCWQWNLPIPSVFYTDIFYLALQRNP